jgi:hypothetical protein
MVAQLMESTMWIVKGYDTKGVERVVARQCDKHFAIQCAYAKATQYIRHNGGNIKGWKFKASPSGCLEIK